MRTHIYRYIIFIKVLGRLENCMMGYAIMLSMKREYGFRTYLDSYVLANLQMYFKNINQIPRLEQLCGDGYTWEEYFMGPQYLAKDTKLSKGRAISIVKCKLHCFLD